MDSSVVESEKNRGKIVKKRRIWWIVGIEPVEIEFQLKVLVGNFEQFIKLKKKELNFDNFKQKKVNKFLKTSTTTC